MDKKAQKRISKFLSLALRHQPDAAGVVLDDSGWVEVEQLIGGINKHANGILIDLDTLKSVVANNDKRRFQFSDDEMKIRATQGHSVNVELGYAVASPPDLLYHGTPDKFVESIRREGLDKRQRHHVHLHQDRSLATSVGSRRGKPVLLTIRAGEMQTAGFQFFVSPNEVWLTDHVPPEYIGFSDEECPE